MIVFASKKGKKILLQIRATDPEEGIMGDLFQEIAKGEDFLGHSWDEWNAAAEAGEGIQMNEIPQESE